jgi:uncharacterized protein (DUF697 family)
MHDIDRIQSREQETFEFGAETEQENFEFQAEQGEVFNENELNELAAELLSVSNEQELNQFLGSLIKKAGKAVGSFVKSPIGQQLGGILKGVAQKALPIAGAALGNMVVPGIGGAIGGGLASMAGKAFGLELEGLSQEDREWEVAKQFVRLAGDATKSAITSPHANPAQAASQAISQAAAKFAPGLLGPAATSGLGGMQSGRWVRRGTKIVLYGV